MSLPAYPRASPGTARSEPKAGHAVSDHREPFKDHVTCIVDADGLTTLRLGSSDDCSSRLRAHCQWRAGSAAGGDTEPLIGTIKDQHRITRSCDVYRLLNGGIFLVGSGRVINTKHRSTSTCGNTLATHWRTAAGARTAGSACPTRIAHTSAIDADAISRTCDAGAWIRSASGVTNLTAVRMRRAVWQASIQSRHAGVPAAATVRTRANRQDTAQAIYNMALFTGAPRFASNGHALTMATAIHAGTRVRGSGWARSGTQYDKNHWQQTGHEDSVEERSRNVFVTPCLPAATGAVTGRVTLSAHVLHGPFPEVQPSAAASSLIRVQGGKRRAGSFILLGRPLRAHSPKPA